MYLNGRVIRSPEPRLVRKIAAETDDPGYLTANQRSATPSVSSKGKSDCNRVSSVARILLCVGLMLSYIVTSSFGKKSIQLRICVHLWHVLMPQLFRVVTISPLPQELM